MAPIGTQGLHKTHERRRRVEDSSGKTGILAVFVIMDILDSDISRVNGNIGRYTPRSQSSRTVEDGVAIQY